MPNSTSNTSSPTWAGCKGTGRQYQAGHSLLRNWKKAKKLLKAIDHAAEDGVLFEEVVRHIEEVDPTGQTFRYPESIKYDQHLKDWASINLAVVDITTPVCSPSLRTGTTASITRLIERRRVERCHRPTGGHWTRTLWSGTGTS